MTCARSLPFLVLSLMLHSLAIDVAAGVPLLLVGLLYPKRGEIKKLLIDIQEQDQKTNTVTTVADIRASKTRQRASIVGLTNSIQWLVPKFEKFQPESWWFGAFALMLRLCQSSMMVVFDDQTIQAACASCVAQVAICSQRNLAPYRRPSDNEIALYAQWLVFIWCSMLLLRLIGAVAYLPTFVVGLCCVIPTVAVGARALQATLADIKSEFNHDHEEVDRVVEERKRAYQKGDFILQPVGADKYEQFVVKPFEFGMFYEPTFESVPESLASEGFQMCRSAGKIWAFQVSAADARTHFSAGRLFASSGMRVRVSAGDYLATPFPGAGELAIVSKQAFAQKYAIAVSERLPTVEASVSVPTHAEVLLQWQTTLKSFGKQYQKKGQVHAKLMLDDGILENVVDGVTEARTSYEGGDFIVIGTKGARYVMPALIFSTQYDRLRPELASDLALAEEGFQLYAPSAKIIARAVTEDEVAFRFPSGQFIDRWGSLVYVNAGDFLATPSAAADNEVFAISKNTFGELYEMCSMQTDDALAQSQAMVHWKQVLQREARVYCRVTKVSAKLALDDGEMDDAEPENTNEANPEGVEMTSQAARV